MSDMGPTRDWNTEVAIRCDEPDIDAPPPYPINSEETVERIRPRLPPEVYPYFLRLALDAPEKERAQSLIMMVKKSKCPRLFEDLLPMALELLGNERDAAICEVVVVKWIEGHFLDCWMPSAEICDLVLQRIAERRIFPHHRKTCARALMIMIQTYYIYPDDFKTATEQVRFSELLDPLCQSPYDGVSDRAKLLREAMEEGSWMTVVGPDP